MASARGVDDSRGDVLAQKENDRSANGELFSRIEVSDNVTSNPFFVSYDISAGYLRTAS
jgi:hypothetical protein